MWHTWAGVVPQTQQLSPCITLVCSWVLSSQLGGLTKAPWVATSRAHLFLSQFNCINMNCNNHVQFCVYKLSIGLEKDQTEGARLRLYYYHILEYCMGSFWNCKYGRSIWCVTSKAQMRQQLAWAHPREMVARHSKETGWAYGERESVWAREYDWLGKGTVQVQWEGKVFDLLSFMEKFMKYV